MKLQKAKIIQPGKSNVSDKVFGGETSGFLDWNDLRFPHLKAKRQELRDKFWKSEEVNMTKDIKQFDTLEENEKAAIVSLLGYLAGFDAPQTRMALGLSLYVTDPAVAALLSTIADQESEHNMSYAYGLSSLVSKQEQEKAFNMANTDENLIKRNQPLVDVYNRFNAEPTVDNILDLLVQSSCLEGLSFYSTFSFFYALARNGKMVGLSTLISYINRDELVHQSIFSDIYRMTLADYPEMNTEERAAKVRDMLMESVELEIEWFQYALKDVTVVNHRQLEGFIKYRANKIYRMLGYEDIYKDYIDNPMRWITAYLDNFDGTKTDFFHEKPRGYEKAGSLNGFDKLL